MRLVEPLLIVTVRFIKGQLRAIIIKARSQMNSLCTKQPLNKGHLCITTKNLFPQTCHIKERCHDDVIAN